VYNICSRECAYRKYVCIYMLRFAVECRRRGVNEKRN